MRHLEIELLDRPEVEVPEGEVSELWEKCMNLLTKYGKGIRTKLASFNVSSKMGEIQLEVSANKRKPSKVSIIRIRPRGYIAGLVLVKKDESHQALILEDWGMGEKLDEVENVVERDAHCERHYTNPLVASIDEFQSYKVAIDEILSSNPIN